MLIRELPKARTTLAIAKANYYAAEPGSYERRYWKERARAAEVVIEVILDSGRRIAA